MEERDGVSESLHEIEAKIDEIHISIKKLDEGALGQSKNIGFEKIISKDNVEKNTQEIIALQTRLENFRAALEEKWNQMKMIEHQVNERKAQMEITGQNITFLTEELKKAVIEIENFQEKKRALKMKTFS